MNDNTKGEPVKKETTKKHGLRSAADRFQEYRQSMADRLNKGAIETPWKAFNDALEGGLRQEVYILGAVSSTGKTSFLLQMADHLSLTRPVLFVALEQDYKQLINRSLSRLTRTMNKKPLTIKGVELVFGGKWLGDPAFDSAAADAHGEYIKGANNLYFLDASDESGINHNHVRTMAVNIQDEHGQAPIIFIDYLQLMAGVDVGVNKTERDKVNENMKALKSISGLLDTPILCISSLNRESYKDSTQALSMASFKESGGIEFSADVLLTLEYQDRDRIEDQKQGAVRYLVLNCLKNRNGAIFEGVSFEFEPAYSLFTDTARPTALNENEAVKGAVKPTPKKRGKK